MRILNGLLVEYHRRGAIQTLAFSNNMEQKSQWLQSGANQDNKPAFLSVWNIYYICLANSVLTHAILHSPREK